jgi:hypothetical protein
MKFINLNLVGYLPNMKVFSSLEILDLSINQLSSNDTFTNLFSNSLKSLNLSYNSIQNSGEHYQISKQDFPQFSSLYVGGNKICGIFPSSWLMNSYSLSLKDHEKSLWCDQFNSAVCSKLQLVQQKYTLLPHETTLLFNYSTSVENECKNYLKSGNLSCQSIYSTNSKEFSVKSSDTVNNLVECPRNLFNETDQIINLVWIYNSTLLEKISSQVAIVNLKYSNISRSDPHLHLSNSIVEMNLTCDQNMTRYRKIESDPIYCEISNNGVVEYYSLATPISKLENIVKCNINNEIGNKEKRIRLVDSTKQFQLTTNYHTFWILDTKISNPEISMFENQDLYLMNTNNSKIKGYTGYSYTLKNDYYSINYVCVFSVNEIQYCQKKNTISLTGDVFELSLEFNDGTRPISNIGTIFYKRNKIQKIFPEAILGNVVRDVFISFNASTLNSTIFNMKVYCIDELNNANFSAVIVNTTTVKCLSVTKSDSIIFKFNVVLVVNFFKMILNTERISFHVISKFVSLKIRTKFHLSIKFIDFNEWF